VDHGAVVAVTVTVVVIILVQLLRARR